jgi:hypothetical protein
MKIILLLISFLLYLQTALSQVPDTAKMFPKIASEQNDSIRARLIWYCLGTSETDPVLDMQIAEKLLVQARKTKDKIGEVFALACLGYDYRAFGDNTKSWKYNLRAISVAEGNPNEESKSIANLSLSLNYEDMANYSKAIKLMSSSIEYASKSNFRELATLGYTFMGELYLNTNKVDSALMFSQRAYELIMRIGYRDYLGPLLQQLGTIHQRLGNSSLAISYYNLAIQEGYRIKSPKFINTSYTAMAHYFYDINRIDSAIYYSGKAIAIVQNTAFTNYSLSPAKLLLDIYRKINIDSAYKYSEIYRIANDSLFNARSVQQNQLLAFEENVRQQQLTEEKLKTEEQRRQNIQYALIAVGLITFIILFLLLSRSFITNTKVIEFFGVIALLIVFEFLNLLLHPFLERETHHSPVMMLLALVCIAALLVPLHHRLEKWSTNKLVEKNKAIRLAMAKRTIEKLEKKND